MSNEWPSVGLRIFYFEFLFPPSHIVWRVLLSSESTRRRAFGIEEMRSCVRKGHFGLGQRRARRFILCVSQLCNKVHIHSYIYPTSVFGGSQPGLSPGSKPEVVSERRETVKERTAKDDEDNMADDENTGGRGRRRATRQRRG